MMMATRSDWQNEPIHFGLWIEVTMLLEYPNSAERQQLLKALGVTPHDFEQASGVFMESIVANTDPERSALFRAARHDAQRGGRAQALEQFNSFLVALNSPLPEQQRVMLEAGDTLDETRGPKTKS